MALLMALAGCMATGYEGCGCADVLDWEKSEVKHFTYEDSTGLVDSVAYEIYTLEVYSDCKGRETLRYNHYDCDSFNEYTSDALYASGQRAEDLEYNRICSISCENQGYSLEWYEFTISR